MPAKVFTATTIFFFHHLSFHLFNSSCNSVSVNVSVSYYHYKHQTACTLALAAALRCFLLLSQHMYNEDRSNPDC